MVAENPRPMKRPRRRVTAELRDFRTFPTPEDAVYDGPFRSNVNAFLDRHAWVAPPSPIAAILAHLVTWRVSFRVGAAADGVEPAVVDLEVVEEDVARSKAVYCDQCRVVGWSRHPVCVKRYHFIIRNDGNQLARSHQNCARCGCMLDMSDMRCTRCKCEMTEDDLEDWAYYLLEESTHLLHGVVHTNGYGHLLRVNGREGGSKNLRGLDIMNFWDRLCKMLRVRKITVMDVSKKYGLEYRLLHAMTTGRPWYGMWGYEFGTGSFAITAEAYRNAIAYLSSIPISIFFSHSRLPRSQLQDVISFYWSLSDHQLVTVSDLFHFVLQLIHEAHEKVLSESASRKKSLQATFGALCVWTREDVASAEETMLKLLRSVATGHWIPWRTLQGATCQTIRSPQMLDYCLKGLSGKLTDDGLVVAAQCNADTHSIEFRLEPLLGRMPNSQVLDKPKEDHLVRDLKFLFDAILNPKTMHFYKPRATRELAFKSAMTLIDCKRFVKNYECHFLSNTNPRSLHFLCEVELVDQPKGCTAPPPEVLVLPETASVAHLKLEAARAFQEVYLVFQRFQVDKLVDYETVRNTTHVKLLFGNSGSVKIRGRCPGDNTRLAYFRMERGTENWIVDCICGAHDDDGERMLACDACGVWKHTRCVGVSDLDEVPKKFVCVNCSGRRVPSAAVQKRKFGLRGTTNKDISGYKNRRCRDVRASCLVELDMGKIYSDHEVQDVTYGTCGHSKDDVTPTLACRSFEDDARFAVDLDNVNGADSLSFKKELASAVDIGAADGPSDVLKNENSSCDNETSCMTYVRVDEDGGTCKNEMTSSVADIINRDLTDRGSGRCKNDMTTPITTEVGRYGNLTTVQ